MNPTNTPSQIVAPSFEQLKKQAYQARLWITIVNLPYFRRILLEEIVFAFRDYTGTILNPDGSPYVLPDIDECFGDDPDCRWFSYYMQANPLGSGPKHPARKLERLQVLALFCWIRYPSVAKHFDR